MKTLRFLAGFALVLLTCACGTGQADMIMPTSTPTPTKSCTATPTPTQTIMPPIPPETGYSNVYGRVLWHGEPVIGLRVFLTNFIEGLETYYEEKVDTDENGRFVFTRAQPGEGYRIGSDYDAMDGFNKREGLYGFAHASPAYFSLPADTNFNFGEYYLIEANLTLLEPSNESTLNEMPTSLQWDAYPGAAYYHVSLSQSNGSYTNLQKDTEETHLKLLPLLDCEYRWHVFAYNAEGKPLARSKPFHFWIKNELLPSCELQVIYPRMLENVSGGRIPLAWDLHPLATSYSIKILAYPYQKDRKPFSELEVVEDWYVGTVIMNDDGSFSEFTPPLPSFGKGSYVWSVDAFTADGELIATGFNQFHVY